MKQHIKLTSNGKDEYHSETRPPTRMLGWREIMLPYEKPTRCYDNAMLHKHTALFYVKLIDVPDSHQKGLKSFNDIFFTIDISSLLMTLER